MRLLPLKFRIDGPARNHAPVIDVVAAYSTRICEFCGLPAGQHAMPIGKAMACVLCGLVQSLQRSTIDEELRLIWLPEMSQAALNVLVRQIHIELQELEEPVHCDATPGSPEGMRPALYNAQRILRERSESVAERLGSARASDLGDALAILAGRNAAISDLPWGGLRALPTGRFYVAGVDVYDEIVGHWRGVGKTFIQEVA